MVSWCDEWHVMLDKSFNLTYDYMYLLYNGIIHNFN